MIYFFFFTIYLPFFIVVGDALLDWQKFAHVPSKPCTCSVTSEPDCWSSDV